jgi:hypothetical protein
MTLTPGVRWLISVSVLIDPHILTATVRPPVRVTSAALFLMKVEVLYLPVYALLCNIRFS